MNSTTKLSDFELYYEDAPVAWVSPTLPSRYLFDIVADLIHRVTKRKG